MSQLNPAELAAIRYHARVTQLERELQHERNTRAWAVTTGLKLLRQNQTLRAENATLRAKLTRKPKPKAAAPEPAPAPPPPAADKPLNKWQASILHHTVHRAANGRYCGGGPVMQSLVDLGLMRSLGKSSWCPDEYFGITEKGRAALRRLSTPSP